MKIVITGATGFVGRALIPLLAASGADLLLVGRTPARVSEIFPTCSVCGYDDLDTRAAGFDLLLHLAVANNDASLSEDAFTEINVEFPARVAAQARQAGIARFVNVSSVHALDERNQSFYARSKRRAAERLSSIQGMEVTTLYLPLVYGDLWGGKLTAMNALPGPIRGAMFKLLAAFKPAVHVSKLADFLLRSPDRPWESEVILSDGQRDNPVFGISKRLVDLAFALSIAALLWWGFILVWAMVRLQSPGPGIFAQDRVGQDGRIFTCYKFRTMKQNTVQAGTHEVSAQSVTGIGSFLRKTKLDELPQIWNILCNEISLIGPRPCLPVQVELVEARRRRGVLSIKPGISGLAQINGIDMSEPERLAQWDARYMALQSLLLDLKILIATATGSGQGDKIVKD